MTDYEHFEEAYEVTKTLEIVTKRDFDGGGGPSTIRIEILHCLKSGGYTVRWIQKTNVRMQPSYPVREGEFATPAGDFEVWIPLDNMPWLEESDEDKAINRAIHWLIDRGA